MATTERRRVFFMWSHLIRQKTIGTFIFIGPSFFYFAAETKFEEQEKEKNISDVATPVWHRRPAPSADRASPDDCRQRRVAWGRRLMAIGAATPFDDASRRCKKNAVLPPVCEIQYLNWVLFFSFYEAIFPSQQILEISFDAKIGTFFKRWKSNLETNAKKNNH